MSLAEHDATFKAQLLALYNDRTIDEQEFVNRIADIITEHIASAEATTTVTGTAGPYPVTGSGTGGLS